MKNTKKTRQGVLDLNHLKAPKNKRLPLMPDQDANDEEDYSRNRYHSSAYDLNL